MTNSVQWVQAGDPVTQEWVHTGPTLYINDPPPPIEIWSLESLTDVEDTTAALSGRALVKDIDGQWRPLSIAAASVPSYRHDQFIAVAVWTIVHNLGRYPSSVSLHSLDLAVDFDEFIVQHLDANSLRVTMDTPTAGVALLI